METDPDAEDRSRPGVVARVDDPSAKEPVRAKLAASVDSLLRLGVKVKVVWFPPSSESMSLGTRGTPSSLSVGVEGRGCCCEPPAAVLDD